MNNLEPHCRLVMAICTLVGYGPDAKIIGTQERQERTGETVAERAVMITDIKRHWSAYYCLVGRCKPQADSLVRREPGDSNVEDGAERAASWSDSTAPRSRNACA